MNVALSEPERLALLHTVGEAYFEVFPTGTIEERLRFLPRGGKRSRAAERGA